MARGGKQPGAGRPKGIPNKATTNAREAIAQFVDGNAHRLVEWLDRIAVDNPKAAFDCFQSIIEYHIPKLARTETTAQIQHTYVVRSPEVSPTIEQWQQWNPEVTIQ